MGSLEQESVLDAQGKQSVNASSRSCLGCQTRRSDAGRIASATDVHDTVNVVAIDDPSDVA